MHVSCKLTCPVGCCLLMQFRKKVSRIIRWSFLCLLKWRFKNPQCADCNFALRLQSNRLIVANFELLERLCMMCYFGAVSVPRSKYTKPPGFPSATDNLLEGKWMWRWWDASSSHVFFCLFVSVRISLKNLLCELILMKFGNYITCVQDGIVYLWDVMELL